MFSHQFYNVVHIVGLVLLVSALGAMTLGAAGSSLPRERVSRWLLVALHAAGVFLLLLGGFGMMARLGIVQGSSWPGWIWVKVGIWAVLAAAAFLPFRYPRSAPLILLLLPVLGGLAAYMAIYKPM